MRSSIGLLLIRTDHMKIGIFTSDFPYKAPFRDEALESGQWGGVGEVVYHLALSLNKMGHEIKIFTVSSNSRDQVYRFENIEVYRYGRLFQVGSTGISLKLLLSPLKYDLDVTNGHRGTPPGALSAYIYSIVKMKPLVLSVHGPYRRDETYRGSFLKNVSMAVFKNILYNYMLKKAKAIIALSNQCVDYSDYLGKYTEKVMIVPNGIDLHDMKVDLSKEECRKLLGLPLGDPIILFLGSLTNRKGPHILLKAAPQIVSKKPTVKIVFLGEGELKENLESLSVNIGVNDSVNFCGFVDEKSKYYYFKAADVFCFPSFREGYPMVLLEASAFGLPLVVSDIDVHRAIVTEGENGLFFRTGDEQDLASKINTILDNPNLGQRLGRKAKENIYSLSWDNVSKKIEDVFFNSLIGGNK